MGIEITYFKVLTNPTPFGKFKVEVEIKNTGRAVVNRAVIEINQYEKNEFSDKEKLKVIAKLGEYVFKKVPPGAKMKKVCKFKEMGGYEGTFSIYAFVIMEDGR